MTRGRKKKDESWVCLYLKIPFQKSKPVFRLREMAEEEGVPLYEKILECISYYLSEPLLPASRSQDGEAIREDISLDARATLLIEEVEDNYTMILETNNQLAEALNSRFALGEPIETYAKHLIDIARARERILKAVAQLPRRFQTDEVRKIYLGVKNLSILHPKVREAYNTWCRGICSPKP
jgi:hypothetical protein